MKWIKILVIIITLLKVGESKLLAQIDTTLYFPLEVGNYWEYWSIGPESIPWFFIVKGDTIMDNGKQYFILKSVYNYEEPDYKYYRLDSKNNLYRYVSYPSCIEKDELLYDFTVKDSAIWPICGSIYPTFPYYYGLIQTTTNYYSIVNSVLKTKWYTHVAIDTTVSPPDTIWNPIFGSMGKRKIAKGIGMVEASAEFSFPQILTGAIIGDSTYGYISGIEESYGELSNEIDNNIDLDIYPNPFNPATNIKFTIPVETVVKIEVFNVLGKKITTILNETRRSGEHIITWNGTDNNDKKVPSGIYLIRITAGNYSKTIKTVLIK